MLDRCHRLWHCNSRSVRGLPQSNNTDFQGPYKEHLSRLTGNGQVSNGKIHTGNSTVLTTSH